MKMTIFKHKEIPITVSDRGLFEFSLGQYGEFHAQSLDEAKALMDAELAKNRVKVRQPCIAVSHRAEPAKVYAAEYRGVHRHWQKHMISIEGQRADVDNPYDYRIFATHEEADEFLSILNEKRALETKLQGMGYNIANYVRGHSELEIREAEAEVVAYLSGVVPTGATAMPIESEGGVRVGDALGTEVEYPGQETER